MEQHSGMRYSIKLRLWGEEIFFGPGIAQLLELVNESHSLNIAARTMGMAYSKAWRIIKTAEKELGYPLLLRKVGGVDGGGSEVTARGRDLTARYLAFEAALDNEAEQLFQRYFGDLEQTAKGNTDGNRNGQATQTEVIASGGQSAHSAVHSAR